MVQFNNMVTSSYIHSRSQNQCILVKIEVYTATISLAGGKQIKVVSYELEGVESQLIKGLPPNFSMVVNSMATLFAPASTLRIM